MRKPSEILKDLFLRKTTEKKKSKGWWDEDETSTEQKEPEQKVAEQKQEEPEQKKTEKKKLKLKKDIPVVKDWWEEKLPQNFKKTTKVEAPIVKKDIEKSDSKVVQTDEQLSNSTTLDSLEKTELVDQPAHIVIRQIAPLKTTLKPDKIWWRTHSTKERVLGFVAVILIIINGIMTAISIYVLSFLAIYFGITTILLYHYRRLLTK
jgi:hypothetical protein